MNVVIESRRHAPATSASLALGLALALSWCQTVWAAAPAAPAPLAPANSGQLLQQVPPPTAPPATAPSVTIMPPAERTSVSTQPFTVEHIDVGGNTVVSDRDIRQIVEPSEGKTLTLPALQTLANAIADLYHKRGYPFAQAYVPAQTVANGRVTITVLEAHYDSVVLRNKSRVRDSAINAALSALKPGRQVELGSLDRALLLTSDFPSTQVKGTLRPGQTLGSSQLLVDVERAPPINASVSVDDYGNAAIGRARAVGNVNFDNPLELGDVLSASALTAGRGMTYGRLGYTLPLYSPATQLQANASTLSYKVVNGGESHLGALGTASAYGASLQQSLWRSSVINFVANAGFESTHLGDEIDASDIHTNRHTSDWHLTFSGSTADHSGTTGLSAGLIFGDVGFDDATAALVDTLTAKTAGRFTRYDLNLSRLQTITDRTSLYATVDYQGSNKNLDVSEQFFIGGPTSARGYDNGFASGSQGNSQTLELRQQLFANAYDRWQGTLFLDHAQIQLQKDRYSSEVHNTADVEDIGVGLNVLAVHGWSVISVLATPIGATPEVASNRPSMRMWAAVTKAF